MRALNVIPRVTKEAPLNHRTFFYLPQVRTEREEQWHLINSFNLNMVIAELTFDRNV